MTDMWTLREAFAQARNGRKIEGIKLMRAATGLGLKEAKDIIEAFLDDSEAANVARTHAAPVVDKCDDGMLYCVLYKQYDSSDWVKHSWDTQHNWAVQDAHNLLDSGNAVDVMVVKTVATTKRTLSLVEV